MIIIGDVHGCYKTLVSLLKQLPNDEICFVGDLIDRGPQSEKVVDLVIENNFDCVMGNHEELMIISEKWDDFKSKEVWLTNGRIATLNNYKNNREKLNRHAEWMNSLPIIKEYKDINLMVSHSSAAEYINSGKNANKKDSVLWDRTLNPEKIPGWFNVFGHVILYEAIITEDFAAIDTGMARMDRLTALQYPEMKIFEQYCLD